jgi:WD40 repeat protein
MLWEVDRDGTGLRRMIAAEDPPWGEAPGFWTPDGNHFIFQKVHDNDTALWVLRRPSGLLKRSEQLTRLGPTGVDFGATTMDPERWRFYGIGSTKPHPQMQRLDAQSKQFAPFLPDVPASAMDFTKDGQWIAYVDGHRRLWRCRNDGSERVQLTLQPLEVELPRWSPDGKSVAFMGQEPGQPWKVRVVSAEGGPYGPVTATDAAEGAPTWSPEGTRLVFGGLVDPGAKTPGPLVIHVFDLRERRLSVVPGSQGLWTARWSPDGRYIAALTEDSSSLVLFDWRSGKWTKLLSLGRIGDLRWSRQGKCIYLTAVPRGGEPALFRVKIASHQVERLIGMASTGISVPLGLAPDDSPLVMYQIPTAEIYAFECQFPK